MARSFPRKLLLALLCVLISLPGIGSLMAQDRAGSETATPPPGCSVTVRGRPVNVRVFDSTTARILTELRRGE